MFAVPRKIITNTILVASLLLPGLAQADATDACFSSILAQNYLIAVIEAKQLLQNGNLSPVEERDAQICLGNAYLKMGHANDALPPFQRVEALSYNTEDRAFAHLMLGSSYIDLHDPDRADYYIQSSLKAFRKLGDKKNEGNMLFRLIEIATIHKQRKEYKKAITLYRQAIDIARRNGDANSTAQWQALLGTTLYEDQQYAAAKKELLAALNAVRMVSDKKWEALVYALLGRLAATMDNAKKNHDEALQWYAKAISLFREIGDTASADEIYNSITRE